MRSIFISVGSNTGDRAANISRTIALLREAGVHVLAQSRLCETEPIELREQHSS